jgi:hypothetical protein
MTSATKQLEVFQDLVLYGPAESRPALRKALLDRVAAPWHHDETKERQLSRDASGAADILAFQREESDGLAGATLTLWSQPDGYKVTNIVPLELGRLGYTRYNAILQDFEQQLAGPAAQQVGFRVKMTAARESIEDWLSPKAAQALWRFSRAANKSTGSSHPLDRERWFLFLIEAHAANGPLDTDTLARWLVEVEGWDDESANELAIEYEFGLDLLSKYDRRAP